MSCISGPNTSITYQQPSHQYIDNQNRSQNFAPTQPIFRPQQQIEQPQAIQYQQQGQRQRGRGGIRTPRASVICHTCQQQGHYKKECQYSKLHVQGVTYLIQNSQIPSTLYAAPPSQQQTRQQQPEDQQYYTPAPQPAHQNQTADASSLASQRSVLPLPQAFSTSLNPHASSATVQQVNQQLIDCGQPSQPLTTTIFEPSQPSYARGCTGDKLLPSTYIEIDLAGNKHMCILDSGCDYSLMPYRLVPYAELKPVNIEVFAANGSPVNILGSLVCTFYIECEKVTINLLVTDDIEEPMLGYDWFCQQDIVWDFGEEEILFRGKAIRLQQRPALMIAGRLHARRNTDNPKGEGSVHTISDNDDAINTPSCPSKQTEEPRNPSGRVQKRQQDFDEQLGTSTPDMEAPVSKKAGISCQPVAIPRRTEYIQNLAAYTTYFKDIIPNTLDECDQHAPPQTFAIDQLVDIVNPSYNPNSTHESSRHPFHKAIITGKINDVLYNIKTGGKNPFSQIIHEKNIRTRETPQSNFTKVHITKDEERIAVQSEVIDENAALFADIHD